MHPPNTVGRKSPLAPFVAFIVTFHVAWIGWPYLVYPRLIALGERTLAYAAVNISLRLLIWVVPVLAYLRYIDRVDPLRYLKLKGHIRRSVVVALALTAFNLAGSILRYGLPDLSLQRVTWNSVFGTSLLVGVIEEIPYRGFMLQKFAERVNFWIANLLTSLLFLAIHLPGWFALHQLRMDLMASVVVLSLVLAIAFRLAKSLWAPILAHSANDFLSFVLFRL